MPGIIRVSVLEAVDLPDVFTDGTTLACVTAKVTLGPRLFKTQPGVADGGRIETWNSDFAFPVMNLRDNLVVSICDSEDQSVTQTAIEIPSIIQKGSRDEFVSLNKGGRIHLRMSFALTDEERKKIEAMRLAAAAKKREEVKKSVVVIQPVQAALPEFNPSLTIANTDVSTASKTQPNRHPEQEPHPSPKPALPLVFNYAKAIGVPSGLKTIDRKRSMVVVPEHSTDEVAGNVNSGVERIGGGGAVGSTEIDASSPAAAASSSGGFVDGTCPNSIHSTAQANPAPPERESESLTKEVTPSNPASDGELGFVPENAVSLESPTCADEPVSVETKRTPVLQNLIIESKARNGYRNSQAQTVENAEPSVLGLAGVDASPITELEPTERASKKSRTSSSGWESVKAPVKSILRLRRSSTPSSGPGSRPSSGPASGPASGGTRLQGWVRKGLANIKGCYAPAY